MTRCHQLTTPAARGPQAWGLSLPDRPILLVDIDRLLETSADVELLGRSGPIRTWRDALTVVLELLMYARTILAADVAILRDLPAGEGRGGARPGRRAPASSWPTRNVVRARLVRAGLAGPDDGRHGAGRELLHLVGGADLGPSGDGPDGPLRPCRCGQTLAAVEEQLAALAERQEAVEARLQRIRRAIVRAYQEEAAPARDRPA